MIDPHVHCRDENLSHKETIAHALKVAESIGLSAIFDMPNNFPVTMERENIEARLKLAEESHSPIFYGIYGGITQDERQVIEMVKVHRNFFPKVVGLKMFAGHSVGNLGIIYVAQQQRVYEILADECFHGVLVVHCEKDELLRPELFDSQHPRTHSYARPPISEYVCVQEQIRMAREAHFQGKLHIAHVSTPESVGLVDSARSRNGLQISCGVTSHHCMLNYEDIPESEEGLIYKVNPPLRSPESRKKMFELLRAGKIDWIETDHAPHTLAEKIGQAKDAKDHPQYMSGFPGLPFYPHFLNYLRAENFSEQQLKALTHHNICRIFGIDIPERQVIPDLTLHSEYEVDVYTHLR